MMFLLPKLEPMRNGQRQFKRLQPLSMYSLLKNLLINSHLFLSEFQNLLREEKVFLFGPSGCGKSRTIIELLRSKKGSYDRIFVINPSNPAGLDSSREIISTLSQEFSTKDLVIWDNFPEGFIKRDLQNAFGAGVANAKSGTSRKNAQCAV
jgi:hypothetical protein